MPIYKCPKCGRVVELPEGSYYCKFCGPSVLMVVAPAENVWREAERFLRKHGYTISKDKFTEFFPSWILIVERYLDKGKFREAVAFIIHEAVECEELKRVVGYWIYPRDYDLQCLRLKDVWEFKKCMDKHVEAHDKAEEMEKLYLSTA
jgi:DNA-directed RNA polymerase subunit RPC12/RpoP